MSSDSRVVSWVCTDGQQVSAVLSAAQSKIRVGIKTTGYEDNAITVVLTVEACRRLVTALLEAMQVGNTSSHSENDSRANMPYHSGISATEGEVVSMADPAFASTITWDDADSGDESFAFIRAWGSEIALGLSLKSNGDIDITIPMQDCERLLYVLQDIEAIAEFA